MSLKHAILAAISQKPQTGYELGMEMEGSICFFWSASRQQIYKELSELEKAAWVSHREVRQEDRPDKKVYHITAPGLQELKDWIGRETDSQPVRDALLIKVFSGHLVPGATLLAEVQRLGEEYSAKLKLLLLLEKQHRNSPNATSPKHQFQYLALRRGIHALRAWLSWADEARTFLENHASRPEPMRSPRRSKRPPMGEDFG